jgi:hypothetical protein
VRFIEAAAFSLPDDLLHSPFEPARIFLGQCISGQNACHRQCLLALNGQEANYSTLYSLKICLNNCDGGFAYLRAAALRGEVARSGRRAAKPFRPPSDARDSIGRIRLAPSRCGWYPLATLFYQITSKAWTKSAQAARLCLYPRERLRR